MPSSYTTSLRLTLPATGELSGQWGNTVNTGITELLDAAVAGTTTISTWGGAGVAYTLSNNSGSADEARRMFIVATGSPGEAKNVICPAVSKFYVFRNDTTGGFALTLKTPSGSGIAVPAGQYKFLYCNGTDVVEAFNSAGSLTLSGALSVGGAVTLTSNPTLSAGTANGVVYLNGSKVVTTGSGLVFDGTNLGIGTSSPGAKLQVTTASSVPIKTTGLGSGSVLQDVYITRSSSGTAIQTGPNVTFEDGTTNNSITIQNSQGNLTFWNYGAGSWSERARITSGGSFQIGSSSASDPRLFVYDNDSTDAAIVVRQDGAAPIAIWQGSGGAERARITSGGDLLVGTTTSGGRATISAVANYNDLATGDTLVLVNTPGTGSVSNPVNVGVIQFGNPTLTNSNIGRISVVQENPGGSTAGSMRFFTNSGGGNTATLERARITSGGDLCVGRTADVSSERLCVEKDLNAAFLVRLRNTNNTSPFGQFISYTAAAPNGTTNQFLRCDDNAATRAEIRSNGGLANYSGNNVNLSDRREKTNFAPAKNYLDTICAIPVQTFEYIDQSPDDPGLTLGVVAQDVQAVAPELVMESNWGTEDNPKMRLSIYQTDLQYALMKCIQELKAQNDDLRARVAALEAA